MPTVNKIELTRILRITPPTLSQWMAKHGSDFPVLQSGGPGRDWIFDLEAVLEFLKVKQEEEEAAERERRASIEQLLLPLGHNGGPPLDPELTALRPAEMLAVLKIRRLQREEAELCGQLVDSGELQEALATAFRALGATLKAGIMRAADEMGLSREQRDLLLARIRETQRNAVDAAGRALQSSRRSAPSGSAEGPRAAKDLLSAAADLTLTP